MKTQLLKVRPRPPPSLTTPPYVAPLLPISECRLAHRYSPAERPLIGRENANGQL